LLAHRDPLVDIRGEYDDSEQYGKDDDPDPDDPDTLDEHTNELPQPVQRNVVGIPEKRYRRIACQ
jgi:hypothetical protein